MARSGDGEKTDAETRGYSVVSPHHPISPSPYPAFPGVPASPPKGIIASFLKKEKRARKMKKEAFRTKASLFNDLPLAISGLLPENSVFRFLIFLWLSLSSLARVLISVKSRWRFPIKDGTEKPVSPIRSKGRRPGVARRLLLGVGLYEYFCTGRLPGGRSPRVSNHS